MPLALPGLTRDSASGLLPKFELIAMLVRTSCLHVEETQARQAILLQQPFVDILLLELINL
jgi:hypothetical protein